VHRAKAVGETRCSGFRVNEVGNASLVHAPKALRDWMIDDNPLVWRDLEVAMDGIANEEGLSGVCCHVGSAIDAPWPN